MKKKKSNNHCIDSCYSHLISFFHPLVQNLWIIIPMQSEDLFFVKSAVDNQPWILQLNHTQNQNLSRGRIQ